MHVDAAAAENEPSLHAVQLLALRSEYRPATQVLHCVTPATEKKPAGHGAHSAAAEVFVYEPAAQGVHAEAFSMLYVPGAQAMHDICAVWF